MKTWTWPIALVVCLVMTAGIVALERVSQAAPVVVSDGLTADWSGGAWTLTATLADTGTQQGERITFTASVEYTRDGETVSTAAEPVTLTVGSSQLKKKWVTQTPVDLEIVAGSESGSGGCEVLPDGRLSWWVTATNDGSESQFSFKVKRK